MSLPSRPRVAAGPVAGAGHPRRLGAGRARARQRDLAWPRRRSSTSSGSATRTPTLSGQRARRRPARRARWATPRSATSTSAPGAVVKQDLARIDDAIADGSFFENEALLAACAARPRQPARAPAPARPGLRRRRPLGLGAPRGADRARRPGGRPRRRRPRLHRRPRHAADIGGRGYLAELERWLRQAGRIGTVSGRYYAMDRDRRWERTKLAYDAIVHAEGLRAASAAEAIAAAYERGRDRRVRQADRDRRLRRRRRGRRRDLHFNFRPDRARQLTEALGEPDFDEFDRGDAPGVELTTMTEYREGWPYPVAFPPQRARRRPWPRCSPSAGERQLHVAETEKYAHVTYFFNGGREAGVGGGGALPGRLAARRPHLRPEAAR